MQSRLCIQLCIEFHVPGVLNGTSCCGRHCILESVMSVWWNTYIWTGSGKVSCLCDEIQFYIWTGSGKVSCLCDENILCPGSSQCENVSYSEIWNTPPHCYSHDVNYYGYHDAPQSKCLCEAGSNSTSDHEDCTDLALIDETCATDSGTMYHL